MNPEDLHILSELEDLLPHATTDEMARLEQEVNAHGGFRDPIVYWSNQPDGKPYIVDGHRRFRVWEKMPPGVVNPPTLLGAEFESLDAVKVWMCRNQLSRRNLTLKDRDATLKTLYEIEKSKSKPSGKNTKTPKKQGQDSGATVAPESDGKARDRVAKEAGVSPRTVDAAVKRENARAEAMRAIRSADHTFAEAVSDGTIEMKDADVRALGKMKAADIKEAVKLIRLGEPWKAKKAAKTDEPPKRKRAVIKDANGTVVPDSVREAFERADQFDVVLKSLVPRIGELTLEISDWMYDGERDERKLPKNGFRYSPVRDALNVVAEMFEDHKPRKVCKKCEALGCNECRGRGWKP